MKKKTKALILGSLISIPVVGMPILAAKVYSSSASNSYQRIDYSTNLNNLPLDQTQINNPESLSARNYLDIANSIAHHLHQQETPPDYCSYSTNATHDIYQTLIVKSNRKDLASKLRISGGTKNLGNPGHAWLEILENNKWTPYESVFSIRTKPILTENNVQEYSKTYKSKRDTLVKDYNSSMAEYTTKPGTETFEPTLRGYLRSVPEAISRLFDI